MWLFVSSPLCPRPPHGREVHGSKRWHARRREIRFTFGLARLALNAAVTDSWSTVVFVKIFSYSYFVIFHVRTFDVRGAFLANNSRSFPTFPLLFQCNSVFPCVRKMLLMHGRRRIRNSTRTVVSKIWTLHLYTIRKVKSMFEGTLSCLIQLTAVMVRWCEHRLSRVKSIALPRFTAVAVRRFLLTVQYVHSYQSHV